MTVEMKRLSVAVFFVCMVFLWTVSSADAGDETSNKNFSPKPKESNGTFNHSTLLSPRRSAWMKSKFPISRPKLRSTSPRPTRRYTTTTSTTTQSPQEGAESSILDTVLKQADIFELSSSDFSPAVAWPVPRRPASRRFRPNMVTSSTTSRPLLKLLQPKPTRPPAYSLDGFVPKPSMIRVTTTEAPAHIRRAYSRGSSTPKRIKTRPLSNDDEDNQYRRYKKNRDSSSRKPNNRLMSNRYPRKGVPGIDFPTYHRIPDTGFDCGEKSGPGMYADQDTGCQVWHMCIGTKNFGSRHSFLCPNGTIFNDRRGVCDWWYNVDCSEE